MARLGRAQPFPWKFRQPRLASSDVTIALTGVAASAAVGLVGVALAVALTGNAATGAVGTVTPSIGVVASLTGVAATSAVGTLGDTHTIALTGPSATGAVGTVSPSISGPLTLPITGVSATGAVGTLGAQGALVADACNTFSIAADESLTVAADDTGFNVVGEVQSFDVEGCE